MSEFIWTRCCDALPNISEGHVLLSLSSTGAARPWFRNLDLVQIGKRSRDGFIIDHRLCEYEDIIAWAPLPKPYQEY